MVTSEMTIVVRLAAEMEVVSRIATPCSSLAWGGIDPPPTQSEKTAPCVAWRLERHEQARPWCIEYQPVVWIHWTTLCILETQMCEHCCARLFSVVVMVYANGAQLVVLI